MATKQYNKQSFEATVEGVEYEFFAHTTNTRCGFCHTVSTKVGDEWLKDTKVSYLNRTWERFDYETALKRAIEKCPKKHQQALYDIIIEKKEQKEHEEAEAFVKAFEQQYNKLSDTNKQRLKGVEVHTQQQANTVMGLMMLANAMDGTL